MRPLTIALGALLLLACSPATYKFTANGSGTTPKPEGCEIKIVSASPGDDFEEIGVAEAQVFSNPPGRDRDAETFRAHVSPVACRSGANVVVPQVNGFGEYVRAVFFKQRSTTSTGNDHVKN